MAWVKIDDRYRTHVKMVEAGAEGVALDVAGLCWSTENATDGFISDAALPALYPVRSPKKVAQRLVDVGRWTRDDERRGYWIHDFLDYNPSAADLAEKRAATKERVRAWRNGRSNTGRNKAGNSVTNGVGNTSSRSPTPLLVSSPSDSSGSREADVGDDGVGHGGLESRLLSVCKARGPGIQDEADEVIRLCRQYLDDRLIDEAIGYIGSLARPPRMPRYLLTVVSEWGPQRGVRMPKLELPKAATA